MFKNLFETLDGIIKGVAYFCVLLIAAVAAVFAFYFIGMTAWRLAQLVWDEIFSHNWSL